MQSRTSGCARFVGSFIFNRKRNVVELDLKQDMTAKGTMRYVVSSVHFKYSFTALLGKSPTQIPPLSPSTQERPPAWNALSNTPSHALDHVDQTEVLQIRNT